MHFCQIQIASFLWMVCNLSWAIHAQAQPPLPTVILGGIGNAASSATNFLSDVLRQQTAMLHRVADTATNYISNAVETPKNLLINATRATTGYIDNAASRGLEFKLRKVLEKFRSRMPYGIPELGLPVMEPLHLDQIKISVDNEAIGKIDLLLEDVLLRNLSTFLVKRAKLELIGPRISGNVTLPKIAAEGYYNISGILGDTFPLYGHGSFNADLYELRIYINVLLGYSNGMYIKSFDLDFDLAQMDAHLENFMGGDEIGRVMSKVFQELTPQALQIIKPDLLPAIKSYIAAEANETIHQLTMKDIVSVLLGQNDIREYAHLLIP